MTSAANSLPVRHASDYWLDIFELPASAGFLVSSAANSLLATTCIGTSYFSYRADEVWLQCRLQTCGLLPRWEMKLSSPLAAEVVVRPGIISPSSPSLLSAGLLRIGRESVVTRMFVPCWVIGRNMPYRYLVVSLRRRDNQCFHNSSTHTCPLRATPGISS